MVDCQQLVKTLHHLSGVSADATEVHELLKTALNDASDDRKKRGVIAGGLLSITMMISTIIIASGSDGMAAYGFQIICNTSKAAAWMFNNVLRTRFGIDFGNSPLGLMKTFFFTALPFVFPEYLLNFASMYRARSAGITLPYLLNFGLAVDKVVQYLLAWLSGEEPSRGDWIALLGILLSITIGALIK